MGDLSDHNDSVWPVASGVHRLNCFPGRGWFADRDGLEGSHRTVLRDRIGSYSDESEKLLRRDAAAWSNEPVWQVTGKFIWIQSHLAAAAG